MVPSDTELDALFERLAASKFRSRFHLNAQDRAYFDSHPRSQINSHASKFIAARLSPAAPVNDGKQTPMRGHPVFVAQHATGTCCRGCLATWHGIPRGKQLSQEQQEYIVGVIAHWLTKEAKRPAPQQASKIPVDKRQKHPAQKGQSSQADLFSDQPAFLKKT